MRIAVLTFDDAVRSHYSVAGPLLKRLGFGATFFISEGFTFLTNKKDYMTWEEIRSLHEDGFEVGNHTRDHRKFTPRSTPDLDEQLEAVARDCEHAGIPRPISFAWPGNHVFPESLPAFQRQGIRFARRGAAPEVDPAESLGPAYEPGVDHPWLIPSTGISVPSWTLEDFKKVLRQPSIPVLQFHGVPEGEHDFANTPREAFEQYMTHLRDGGWKGIAVRDLPNYVDVKIPADPWEPIRNRLRASGRPLLVEGVPF